MACLTCRLFAGEGGGGEGRVEVLESERGMNGVAAPFEWVREARVGQSDVVSGRSGGGAGMSHPPHPSSCHQLRCATLEAATPADLTILLVKDRLHFLKPASISAQH